MPLICGDPRRRQRLENRLLYGSFACLDRGYLFLETPKAACTTMKWVLASLTGAEVPRKQVGKETSVDMSVHKRRLHPVKSLLHFSRSEQDYLLTHPEVFRFTVVRNPYSRLVSAFNDKIRNFEPSYQAFWKRIATEGSLDIGSDGPTFPQFVSWLTRTQNPNHTNLHWQSMTSLNFHRCIEYSSILKVETLLDDVRMALKLIAPEVEATQIMRASRVNEGLPCVWSQYYDNCTAGSVREFYHDDFERFGYETDSWRRTAGQNSIPSWDIERSAIQAIRARNIVISELLVRIANLQERARKNPPEAR